MQNILKKIKADYLLVNSTNEYLSEYPSLKENARYTLTGFSGSTGDVLLSKTECCLFVDGRYHTQADNEVKDVVKVVHLQLGENQDNEITKKIKQNTIFAIVSKKVSQARLENFQKLLAKKNVKIILLEKDYINNFTEKHSKKYAKVNYKPKKYNSKLSTLITNFEEVSYLTRLRDFSVDCSSKIWQKLFIENGEQTLFTSNSEFETFIRNYDKEIQVDKSTINAYDYALIKHPVNVKSKIATLKSVKTKSEIESYKKAFDATDKALKSVREFIENTEEQSEYDIAEKLKQEFIKFGAKNLSFNPIVAINQNSALAHYSKKSKDVKLHDGDLVLIDCGAYYEDGLATDITRVFVKGDANELQKKVYTTVLKSFLNCFNSDFKTGFEYDKLAHKMLDNSIDGFSFSHGLGHGIGINVHEAPPALNQSKIAHTVIKNNMTFTIEPGLYNPKYFGIRLENSCYKKDGKIISFVKMGYEGKLIDYNLLNKQEQKWLEEFEIL